MGGGGREKSERVWVEHVGACRALWGEADGERGRGLLH